MITIPCSSATLPGARCRNTKRAGAPARALPQGSRLSSDHHDHGEVRAVSGSPSFISLDRRQLGLSAALLLLTSNCDAQAEEAVLQAEEEAVVPPPVPSGVFKTLEDATLAYQFKYPVESASGEKLSMAFSRRPEKYSSAAPLSADARQRIVTELLDLKSAVTVSVTVGPASGALKNVPVDRWDAEVVAQTVLIDRSTARVTTGQRVALNSIETATKEERDGVPYFYYEHVAQGAPNLSSGRLESFRHALAVTTVRPGQSGSPFLYTFNIACPDTSWDNLEPAFKEAVASFELKSPTNNYIPPDKDPWLFF